MRSRVIRAAVWAASRLCAGSAGAIIDHNRHLSSVAWRVSALKQPAWHSGTPNGALMAACCAANRMRSTLSGPEYDKQVRVLQHRGLSARGVSSMVRLIVHCPCLAGGAHSGSVCSRPR
jgi:hypothetical protein